MLKIEAFELRAHLFQIPGRHLLSMYRLI